MIRKATLLGDCSKISKMHWNVSWKLPSVLKLENKIAGVDDDDDDDDDDNDDDDDDAADEAPPPLPLPPPPPNTLASSPSKNTLKQAAVDVVNAILSGVLLRRIILIRRSFAPYNSFLL